MCMCVNVKFIYFYLHKHIIHIKNINASVCRCSVTVLIAFRIRCENIEIHASDSLVLKPCIEDIMQLTLNIHIREHSFDSLYFLLLFLLQFLFTRDLFSMVFSTKFIFIAIIVQKAQNRFDFSFHYVI